MKTLKERLIYARKMGGFTQKSLAENTSNVTRSMIANMESGRWKANPLAIKELSKTLDVEFEWLMNGTGPMKRSDEMNYLMEEISEEFSRLTAPQKEFILDMIQSMQKHNIGK